MLLQREQVHTARERANDELIAAKSLQLQSVLSQLERLRGTSPELTIAIKRAAQIGDALTDDTVDTSDLQPQTPQAAPSAAPTSSESYAARTLATGLDSGWDVDVFWCDGTAAKSDYDVARAAATALAGAAQKHDEIAPGVRLGVVRLRPVPDTKLAGWIRGTRVIADAGPGDVEARDAIIGYLTKKSAGGFSRANSVGRLTRYYISVSACNSPPG